ncbi:hypothetical protein GCM10027075_77930 [Streptomyces heilongjiangensis]
MEGEQRRRLAGVDGDRGPGQAQGVGDPTGGSSARRGDHHCTAATQDRWVDARLFDGGPDGFHHVVVASRTNEKERIASPAGSLCDRR